MGFCAVALCRRRALQLVGRRSLWHLSSRPGTPDGLGVLPFLMLLSDGGWGVLEFRSSGPCDHASFQAYFGKNGVVLRMPRVARCSLC